MGRAQKSGIRPKHNSNFSKQQAIADKLGDTLCVGLKSLKKLPLQSAAFQNAWVVDDLETACTAWVQQLGVGPFFITEYAPGAFASVTYRGAPSELAMRIGIAQAGPIQIELIQPITEQSAFRMSVPAGSGQGFHHIGIWTENFDQALAEFNDLGFETINTGRTRSTDFAYLDARPLLGCMLEIVTKTPLIERRFSEIAAAAEGWQGDAPLRYA